MFDRILVVDDNAGDIELCKADCGDFIRKIDSALTFDEAIGLMRNYQYDFVIFDYNIPPFTLDQKMAEIKKVLGESHLYVQTGMGEEDVRAKLNGSVEMVFDKNKLGVMAEIMQIKGMIGNIKKDMADG